jgi:hypothetical protein
MTAMPAAADSTGMKNKCLNGLCQAQRKQQDGIVTKATSKAIDPKRAASAGTPSGASESP